MGLDFNGGLYRLLNDVRISSLNLFSSLPWLKYDTKTYLLLRTVVSRKAPLRYAFN